MACKGLGKCQYLLSFFPSLWPVVSGMNQTDKKIRNIYLAKRKCKFGK